MGGNEALTKIDHVAIKSSNISRDTQWYSQEFGLEVTYQDETWALLESSTCFLALVTPGQHPAHVSFLMEGEPPHDALKHRDGTFSKYGNDLSGNIVEYLWRNDSVK